MGILENINSKRVIVFGAGKVGIITIERMILKGLFSSIIAAAVTDEKDNPKSILQIPVMSIEKLAGYAPECMIVIAVMEEKQPVIRKLLFKLGFYNVCAVSDDEYKQWRNSSIHRRYIEPYEGLASQLADEQLIDNSMRQQLEMDLLVSAGDRLNISRLVVVLGTKCNLRCKECNNLMPHFKPQRDLDKNRILRSLEIFLDKVQNVLICELIGGEPFLSSNLEDVIKLLLDKKNVFQIEITTNGTIQPSAALTKLLQNSKVKVRVSDYGKLVDKNKITQFLIKNNICYQVLKFENWISSGGIEKRQRSREQLKTYYKNCLSGYYCKTLYDGKIFACARSASLYSLGYMKEEEFLEIKDTMDVSAVMEFWLKDYSEACDYCDAACEDRKIIEPAEQIGLDIE